jgi:hypothetical protein
MKKIQDQIKHRVCIKDVLAGRVLRLRLTKSGHPCAYAKQSVIRFLAPREAYIIRTQKYATCGSHRLANHASPR